MKSRLPVLFSVFLLALGCSKDNNDSAPSIKIKSYTDQVSPGGAFNAVFTYSQKGGNISQDSLIIIRHWYNQTPLPPGVEIIDTFLTFLPETPNTGSAEFSVSMLYELIYIDIGEPDTIGFKFVLMDENGKHSDTVSTGKIVLLQ